MKKQTAILLVNTGSPSSPGVKQVRAYLSQFLNDKHVIDLPWLARKILVNLFIVPFRAPKSSKLYKKIWTAEGSPLLIHSEALRNKLQAKMTGKAEVFVAMSYGNPSINEVCRKIAIENYRKLIVLPLFPQYAMSTTGSIMDAVKREFERSTLDLKIIEQFYEHPEFIDAFAHRIASYEPAAFSHIVFSYHGLPNRHLDKSHPGISHKNCICENKMPEHGTRCYKAACYETSRLLAKKLGLKPKQYTVAFQSRLSRNWMKPFTDEVLKKLAQEGKKKVLVAAPAFVADCLETILELGVEYHELFKQNGGQNLTLVESLNSNDTWVDALEKIITPQLDSETQ